jgi:hypothetical protein
VGVVTTWYVTRPRRWLPVWSVSVHRPGQLRQHVSRHLSYGRAVAAAELGAGRR